MKISRSSFFLSSLLLFTAVLMIGCSADQIEVTGVRTYSGGPAETESTLSMSGQIEAGADIFPADSGRSGPGDGDVSDVQSTQDADSDTNPVPEPQTEAQICVFVCGCVAEPDVYYLPFGSRIGDAVEAAGGFLSLADREWLNLAEPLRDGERVQVFSLEETDSFKADGVLYGGTLAVQSGGFPAGGTTAGSSGLTAGSGSAEDSHSAGINSTGGTDTAHSVNINTAGKEELMTLPGIGESKAEAIIRYRDENGPFASPEDIMNVPGIKEAAYSKLSGRIAV